MSELRHEVLSAGSSSDILYIDVIARPRAFYSRAKRLIDVMATLAIAPFVLPVIAVAAALVRLDGGPAFYKQERVGKGGAIFTLWKLRSMRTDAARMLQEHLRSDPIAQAEWDANQKLRADPRITKVGAFLRKYSIDELPQFLNVLRGEMSLVGPRPIMPEQRQQYAGVAYFRMRPGLTGLWQVSDRNECSFTERAMHDTSYATTMSFELDVRILLRTVGVVLHGTGL